MTPRLKFVSYNVHGFVDNDGHYQPEQTMAVIAQLQADVIALQEVQGDDRRGIELLQQFAADHDYQLILGSTIQQSNGHHYGNALLVPTTPDQLTLHDISLPGREPRGIIDCKLKLQGEPWHLYATHLGLSPAERRQQTKQLLATIQRQHHQHTALLGDINEWFNWGRPLRWLRAYFKSTAQPPTFPARWPLLSLDRIWIHSRRHTARLYACKSRLCRQASDHLPLIAEIQPVD